MPAGPGTTFVGRRRELAALSRVVASSRLVTLTGAGGTGKTRLAAALVPRIRSDDVAWIDLAPVRESREVAVAVEHVLGGRDGAEDTAGLTTAASARRALVILDNCEHVLVLAAEAASKILSASPGCRVIATSRTPLGSKGEVVWRVPPLSLAPPAADAKLAVASDAVKLFVERARSARRTFAPSDLDLDSIVWICNKLDGLPLAIELTAARVRHMSVAELRARLDVLPPPEELGDDARHASMAAAIEWSHSLLEPAERMAFRRASVFTSDFPLSAADALCAGDLAVGAAAEATTGLVDRSLMEFLPDLDRYRMLEPIREYAAAQLEESGEAEVAISRAARYLVGRHVNVPGKEVTGPVVAEMRRDFVSASMILPWLTEHDPAGAIGLLQRYANARWTAVPVHVEAVVNLLSRAVDAYPGRDAVRVGGLLAIANLRAEILGRPDATMVPLAEEALRLAIGLADRSLEGRARLALANAALGEPANERAIDLFDEALPLLPARARALALSTRAVLNQHLHRPTDASADLAAAFAAWDAIPDHSPGERGLTHLCAADIAYRRGELALAESHVREAIELRRRSGQPPRTATYEVLGHLAAAQGQDERALRLDGYADRMRLESGFRPAHFLALSDRKWVQAVERRIGSRAQRIREEGRRWTATFAVAYALGEAPSDELTERERAVARLVADGLSDKEIGARLGISTRTAQNHVQHIREKLGSRSRVDIARSMANADQSA